MNAIQFQKIAISLTLVCTIFSSSIFAQDFEVPKKPRLNKAEDYTKYQQDVLDAIAWLKATPHDQQQDKRTEVFGFFLQWITGAPNVTIELNASMVSFHKKNPELLMIFMAGWTEFALTDSANKDNVEMGSLAGAKTVIDYYKANKDKGLKKDKLVEKWMVAQSEGSLEQLIKDSQ